MSLQRFCDRCEGRISSMPDAAPGKVIMEIRPTVHTTEQKVERELCHGCTLRVLDVIRTYGS